MRLCSLKDVGTHRDSVLASCDVLALKFTYETNIMVLVKHSFHIRNTNMEKLKQGWRFFG